jgi:streptogramin lyase
MNDITELLRLDIPIRRPQAIAFAGAALWLGSVETNTLYRLDPRTWTVQEELPVPGAPFGMVWAGDGLLVVLGEGEDSDRTIYRVDAGSFTRSGAMRCPDDGTGSHLSYNGTQLFLSQWGFHRILALDSKGMPTQTISLPRGVCGHTYVDGPRAALRSLASNSGRTIATRTKSLRLQGPILRKKGVDA